MKKIITLISAVVLGLSAYAGGLPVPYIAENSGYDNWDIKNLNNDNQTWTPTTGSDYSFANCTKGLKYHWHSSNAADDWAISPAIHLEAGKEYKIKFAYKTGNYNEKLTVWIASGNTPELLQQGVKLADYTEKQSNGVKEVKIFTPAADGDYYLGAYVHSDKDLYYVYFTGVSIAENVFAPAAATGLTVTPGANRALEAKLTWTLPTTDTDDVPFGDGVAVEAVVVYRDGVKVADLPGTATEWTDNAEKGLTAGKHKYEVEVTVKGAKSAKAAVNSPYIGPLAAFDLPLIYDFKDITKDDFGTFFTVIKGDNSTVTTGNGWDFRESAYSGNAAKIYPGGKVEDDWLVLPPVKVTKAGLYRFGLDIEKNSTMGRIDIKYGKIVDGVAPGIAELTGEVGTYQKEKIINHKYLYYTFSFDEPGEYNLALHACASESDYSYYYVYGFSLEEWHDAALNATDLATEVIGNDVKISWTNPAKTSGGNDITELVKVEVYRDSVLAGTVTEGLVPGASSSFTDVAPPAGSHLYKVVAYNGEFAPDQAAPEVWSDWIGDKLQELPFEYKFSSAKPSTYALFTPEKINEEDPDWTFSTAGAVLPLQNKNLYQPNSRLYTPPFVLAPGYYDVTLKMLVPCNKYNFTVGYAMEAEAGQIKGQNSKQVSNGWSASETSFRIKVDDEGRGMFVAIANDWTGESNTLNLTITEIKVVRTLIIPEAATDVEVKAAEDRSLQATISWKNPATCNVEGVTPVLTKAVVYRNDEPIGTVTEGLVCGEISSYLDAQVPNAGSYTYKVEIYSADGCAEATGVTSPWIGLGKDLPYEYQKGEWTIVDANNDERTWNQYYDYMTIISYTRVANDWAISPRLNMQKDFLYTISCYPTKGTNSEVTDDMRINLYYGTGVTPGEMTIKLAEIGPFKTNVERELFTVQILAVDPATYDMPTAQDETPDLGKAIRVPAGVATLGLHCDRKTDEVYIREFKVDGGTDTGIRGIFSDGNDLFGADARDIMVYDLAGRAILGADSFESLDTKRLAKGTYIVTGSVNGKRVSAKVAF